MNPSHNFKKWLEDRRAGSEDGTASMETLLSLPFIFILLVLVVDLGYGQVIRIKAQGAVRFAGTSFMRAPDGVDRAGHAKDLLRTHYAGLQMEDSVFVKGPKSPFRTSRRLTHLTVAVEPLFGTILTAGQVKASFIVLNYRVWNYDKVPLAVGPVLDMAKDPKLAKYIGGFLAGLLATLATFFGWIAWFLGMKP